MAKQKKAKRPVTAQQLKNLKPWKKGQSGNPNGRPRKLPRLDKLIDEVLGDSTNDGRESKMREIITTLMDMATDPNNRTAVKAAALLIERAYGKTPMVIKQDITTKGESINNGVDMKKLDDDTLKKLINALE